jgi:GH15 family glucan-1,4-alpha-glucosidase
MRSHLMGETIPPLGALVLIEMNNASFGTPIADYGMLSDCNSAALVDRVGSIDWLCLPRYDSRAVFARLLDPDGGHWSITPTGGFEVTRRYLPGSLVLETTFETPTGRARLVDALAFAHGQRGHELGLGAPHEVLRLVECTDGQVEFAFEMAPRPEYGLSRPLITASDDGARTIGGPDRFCLTSGASVFVEGPTVRARFRMGKGDHVGFALRWSSADSSEAPPTSAGDVRVRIEDAANGWTSWEADHDIYDGPHRDTVRFSSRLLKGLSYRHTGAIVAAPTTSLPETVGGVRNWDYRYAWIRDASLALDALWIGACPDEVVDFARWMTGAAGGHVEDDRPLQIMYGVAGERDLSERALPHLRGWRNSRPVRVGNAAWTQTQLDVYGEFLNALWLYSERLGELDPIVEHFIADLADAAARDWKRPDAGMWEMRAEPRHHVSSKLLCWVALDRAVKLAPRVGADEHVDRWTEERDAVRGAILERGWSAKRGAFSQAFDSDELDASVLLMPIYGFLPAGDDRMRSTIEAIERDLTEDGLVLRYRSDDGLKGEEGTFVVCSYWLASCLAYAGAIDRAEALFNRLQGFANDLGLLSEEIDVATGELLGNFPQAFSHIGLITAAWAIDQAREG